MARRIRLDLMIAGSGTGNAFDWPGGDGVLDVDATFGGGSVALQKLSQSGAWLPIQNYATTTPISLTANGTANFRAAAGPIRVLATTATAVNAYASGVPSTGAG